MRDAKGTSALSTRSANLRVVHLLEAPEAALTLARWFVEEWAPWYGPSGEGDAEGDLAACCRRDNLPICLVALGLDDEVLGTIALKAESVGSELGVGPWLAAFLVGIEHRSKGVGTALVAAMEARPSAWGSRQSTYPATQPMAY